MKYKTKPFEIEAVQFTGSNWLEVRAFVGRRFTNATKNGEAVYIVNFQKAGTYTEWTDKSIIGEVYDYLHETWVGVHEGDWIIKGSKNEFYPCDPEVFESKYEPAYATGGVVKDSSFVPDNGCITPNRKSFIGNIDSKAEIDE